MSRHGKHRRGFVHCDRKKMFDVVVPILSAYRHKKGVFAAIHYTDAPQNLYIPEWMRRGSIEHAIFLSLIASVMYRDNSTRTFRLAKDVCEREPRVLTPDVPPYEELVRLMRGFSMPATHAHNWRSCCLFIYERLGGDPRNFFRMITSVDDFKYIKKQLKKNGQRLDGLGPKTFSLLNIFLYEIDLVALLPDALPVDLHIMRQFMSWGIITGKGVHGAATVIAEKIRKELSRLSWEVESSPYEVSHALWLLGNSLCQWCTVTPVDHLCPAFTECRGRVYMDMYTRRGLIDLSDIKHNRKGVPQAGIGGSGFDWKALIQERTNRHRKNAEKEGSETPKKEKLERGQDPMQISIPHNTGND